MVPQEFKWSIFCRELHFVSINGSYKTYGGNFVKSLLFQKSFSHERESNFQSNRYNFSLGYLRYVAALL